MILSTGATLEVEPDVLRTPPPRALPSAPAPRTAPPPIPTGTTLAEAERRAIVRALEQCGWVVEGARGAARVLGLQPSTLRSRMKKLGIRREGADAR